MGAREMQYFLENREWLCEHANYDEIESMTEFIPYDLIHGLLKDIQRLSHMVREARTEVNGLMPGGAKYDLPSENVGGDYFDHPALGRYVELFGDEALKPWAF